MGNGITKKEHYVPQCYLKAWCVPNTEQVFVYDKKRYQFRKSSIKDIASERYFYDTEFINLLNKEQLQALSKGKISIRKDADPQILEHTYADIVETFYKDSLDKLINDARKATPWTINNCYFVMPKEKEDFSQLLTIQFLRTKQMRNEIGDSSKLLLNALKEMGFSEEQIAKYDLSKEQIKNIHLRMLNDIGHLTKIAESFYYLTWVLCINRTDKKFYTSDSPIIRRAHIHDPIIGTNGLRSKGIEVFIPLAPDILLLMLDGVFHGTSNKDRRYIEFLDSRNIDYYNSLTILNCDTCIFSQDEEWSTLYEIKARNPNLFKA